MMSTWWTLSFHFLLDCLIHKSEHFDTQAPWQVGILKYFMNISFAYRQVRLPSMRKPVIILWISFKYIWDNISLCSSVWLGIYSPELASSSKTTCLLLYLECCFKKKINIYSDPLSQYFFSSELLGVDWHFYFWFFFSRC